MSCGIFNLQPNSKSRVQKPSQLRITNQQVLPALLCQFRGNSFQRHFGTDAGGISESKRKHVSCGLDRRRDQK